MEAVPSERWEVNVSQANQHLHSYAMEILRWMVYFNRFYARKKFCTLMGLADDHHHVRYAMYILEELGILSRCIHGNVEPLFGLCPALRNLEKSNTVPIEMANHFLRKGSKIKCARKVALAKTERANMVSRKRKADNATKDKDTEDDETAAGNSSEALESPSSP